MVRLKRPSGVERKYIREEALKGRNKGTIKEAAKLSRRRVMRLLVGIISSDDLKTGGSYDGIRLQLIEVYEKLSSSRRFESVDVYERMTVLLEEVTELLRERAEPSDIEQIMDEIGGITG